MPNPGVYQHPVALCSDGEEDVVDYEHFTWDPWSPPRVSLGQERVEVNVLFDERWIAGQLGTLFNQVVVTVEDVVVESPPILHSGYALPRKKGMTVDPNEISGLCCEGALNHLLH